MDAWNTLAPHAGYMLATHAGSCMLNILNMPHVMDTMILAYKCMGFSHGYGKL